MKLQTAKNEVYQKTGRNLLLFQQLENLFKHLVTVGKMEGTIDEIEASQKKKVEVVINKTLGLMISDFEEIYYENAEEEFEPDETSNEIQIKLRVRMPLDDNTLKTRQNTLDRLRMDRNEMVHHFLRNIDLRSVKGCRKASLEMDELRDRILPEIKWLSETIKWIRESGKESVKMLVEELHQKA